MKTKLVLSPRTKLNLKLSLRIKIVIGSTLFAAIVFLISFFINNLGINKTSIGANKTLFFPNSNNSPMFIGGSDYVTAGNIDLNLKNIFTVHLWDKWNILPSESDERTINVHIKTTAQTDAEKFGLHRNPDESGLKSSVTTITDIESNHSATESVALSNFAGHYEQSLNDYELNDMLNSDISVSHQEAIEISIEFLPENIENIIIKVEDEIKAFDTEAEFEIIDSPINVKYSEEMYLPEDNNTS